MKFLYPIFTEQTECQDCYKCVRNCPCKAIRVENSHATVVPELCVLCGRCVTDCPAHAKHVRDDLTKTKRLFNISDKVFVSLAPSFASEFSDYTIEELCGALKLLGFYAVSETAIGADIVSNEIAKRLSSSFNQDDKSLKSKLFLSSACPAAVEYIRHKLPEYSEYITDCASPLLAHARFIKSKYGKDAKIVFVGPCIAKKREADTFSEIDVAISFTDLRQWLKSAELFPNSPKIKKIIAEEKCNFVPERAGKGSLYPLDGGMCTAIKAYETTENALNKVRMLSVSGIDQIPSVLEGISEETLKQPLFIEFLSCVGGCVNGPGTSTNGSTALKQLSVEDYANPASVSCSKEILDSEIDLKANLEISKKSTKSYKDDDIRKALRSVGKFSPADEVNCSCCGYDTCRDFACAMLDKRAEKTMCLSYMRKLAQKKANGLIQAIPSGVVIADRNLNIVECNKNFAKLMGPEIEEMYNALPGLEGADLSKITALSRFFADVLDINGPDIIEREVRDGKKIFHVSVFEIGKDDCVGGVIEDVTAPQVQRNRIITQAKKVIDKNLSVVQKIAFLLGENAAETESMLNSIIESFANSENEPDPYDR
jgi:iron only hydrogenase large subunit-like protein